MPKFAPGDVNEYSTPLDVAFAHLAVEETPGHPNRGKMVDKYIKFCHLEPSADSYKWCCAAVVYWCHHGGVLWVPKTASVRALWDRVADMRVTEPQMGDAFVHISPKGNHIGLVAAPPSRTTIHSVEGNSNRHGSRNGNAVVRGIRSRLDGYITGYIRLSRIREIGVA